MPCEHLNTQRSQATRDIAGLIFAYETKRCVTCGSLLWSQANEVAFQLWQSAQQQNHADAFVIQNVILPGSIVALAVELGLKYQGTDRDIYRACLSWYFSQVSSRNESLTELEAMTLPVVGTKTKINIQVSPRIFLNVESSARLFDLQSSDVSAWIIERMLCISLNDDWASQLQNDMEAHIFVGRD